MKSFKSFIREETIKLAGETLQNMEHCPGAVSAFKENLKDGASESDVAKAAKAVDAYLAIEDKAKKSGATDDDVEKMKALISNAKEIISDLGLKGHTYHDMHLKRVKEMISESCAIYEELVVEEAEFEGRKVKLNDPIRTSENPNKKFKVYVRNEKGNVVVVRFGDPNMEIKRDDPARRKSFRARHNCDDPGPKWKARYWSCWQWRSGAKVDN